MQQTRLTGPNVEVTSTAAALSKGFHDCRDQVWHFFCIHRLVVIELNAGRFARSRRSRQQRVP